MEGDNNRLQFESYRLMKTTFYTTDSKKYVQNMNEIEVQGNHIGH